VLELEKEQEERRKRPTAAVEAHETGSAECEVLTC
jgi:hypothetical protein